jgi:glycosyltransferase involved in cell wall biosynthesis
MAPDTAVIVTAHNEADRLPATLQALAAAFPGARILVADDGSTDGSADVAAAHGAEVVRSERNVGKGGVATLGAQRLLALLPPADMPAAPATPPGGASVASAPQAAASLSVVLLCDGDLAASADALKLLVEEVRVGRADLAIARFAQRVGGGFGWALGFARWAIRKRCGYEAGAPISGQRALRADVLPAVIPFAPRFGMEIGMTIDAVRAGFRVSEVELPLAHRATGKTLRGFLHRGRQLLDFVAVWWARRTPRDERCR